MMYVENSTLILDFYFFPKCNYHLPHFESSFNPKIHNKFIARQEHIRLKKEEEELFEVKSP